MLELEPIPPAEELHPSTTDVMRLAYIRESCWRQRCYQCFSLFRKWRAMCASCCKSQSSSVFVPWHVERLRLHAAAGAFAFATRDGLGRLEAIQTIWGLIVFRVLPNAQAGCTLSSHLYFPRKGPVQPKRPSNLIDCKFDAECTGFHQERRPVSFLCGSRTTSSPPPPPRSNTPNTQRS